MSDLHAIISQTPTIPTDDASVRNTILCSCGTRSVGHGYGPAANRHNAHIIEAINRVSPFGAIQVVII